MCLPIFNQVSGITTAITTGTADGARFTCTSVMTEPVRLEMSYDGTVAGDSITGDITIKGIGTFPLDGTRIS